MAPPLKEKSIVSRRRIKLLEERLAASALSMTYQATCVTCGLMRWRNWTEQEVAVVLLVRLTCGRCGSTIIEVEPANFRDQSVTDDLDIAGPTRRCMHCDVPYRFQKSNQKYCSGSCSNKARCKDRRQRLAGISGL